MKIGLWCVLLMSSLLGCSFAPAPINPNDPAYGARPGKPGASQAFEGEEQLEADDPALQNGPPSVFKPTF